MPTLLRYGCPLNWAGLCVKKLAQDALPALERVLVLCCKWRPYTIFWSHTSARVSGCSPSQGTIIAPEMHYPSGKVGLTHWSHSLANMIPSVASAAQSNHNQYVPVCRPFPNRLATVDGLHELVFLDLQTDHFLPFPLDKPPTTSLIFPVSSAAQTSVSINL